MDPSDTLRKSPLFSGLTDPEIARIMAIGVTKNYRKGELIFSEGERATGIFVNLSGQIKVYKISHDGKEQILHIIFPAEPFAEAALFAGSTYPAFAESLTRTRVFYIPKERFFDLIRANPQLSLNMIASLSLWLRRFVGLVEELSLMDVSARVSKFLLDLSIRSAQDGKGGSWLELDMSKTQLASKLGTISETLSRVFRKLRDRKIIQMDGRRILILNRKALEEISSGASL